MAHPKRRHSNQRTRKRRTHDKIAAPVLVNCPQCHQATPPHKVCANCGYYDGREVVKVES